MLTLCLGLSNILLLRCCHLFSMDIAQFCTAEVEPAQLAVMHLPFPLSCSKAAQWQISQNCQNKIFKIYKSIKTIISGTQSDLECLTVWIRDRPDFLRDLIRVQTICQCYQQSTQL